MEHAESQVFLGREMPYTRHHCLPQRPITGPLGKDFIDGRIVEGRLALGIVRYGPALPVHACLQTPHDEVEDARIAQLALWTALGHGEVRQEKCGELRFRELDRHRRRGRRWCRGAPHAMASYQEV